MIIAPIVTVLVLLGLYFAPAIVGYTRKVKNAHSVMVLNLFFGITIIGWAICLAMALRDAKKV